MLYLIAGRDQRRCYRRRNDYLIREETVLRTKGGPIKVILFCSSFLQPSSVLFIILFLIFSFNFFVLQLTVIQGNIVQMGVDAIVHPTSNTFYMGGEVGKTPQDTSQDEQGGKSEGLRPIHTAHVRRDATRRDATRFFRTNHFQFAYPHQKRAT